MMLAIHVVMTGRVDRGSSPAAMHQPRPYRIETRFFGLGMAALGGVQAMIRPEGWSVPPGESQVHAERYGMRARAVLPMLADWSLAAGHVLMHDAEETDHALRVWRAMCGGQPEWLRAGQQVIDTAKDAALAMDLDRLPSLAEATTALVGKEVGGVDGVVALNSADAVQAMRRAA